MRAFVLAAALLASSSAFAIEGIANISGFVTPGYGGPGTHAFMPSGEAKFWEGVARTSAIVDAAGRSMRTEATIARAAGAGRVLWSACAANPVVCAGGAAFVYYMTQDGTFEYDSANNQFTSRPWKTGYEWYTEKSGGYSAAGDACTAVAKEAAIPSNTYVFKHLNGCTDSQGGTVGAICYCRVESFATTGNKASEGFFNLPVNGKPLGKIKGDAIPATQAEIDQYLDKNEPDDAAAQSSGQPIPAAAPQIAPVRSPLGEPYKNAQGQTRQDVMECKQTSGAASPLSMTCTTFSIDPATDSPTKATPAPQPPQPGASTPTGTAPPAQEKPVDLCAANPDIVACAKFGTVPQSETLPKKITPVNFISEPLGLPDACPAPIAGPGGVSIPFDSACEAFRMLRPLVVAMAAVLSMLMVVGALRTS